MTKFEVFINETPSNEDYLEINIFSRVKMAWVYNDSVRVGDLFFLLSDLQVNARNSIIRMSPETQLYKEFIEGGYIIKLFFGGNAVKRKNALEKLRTTIKRSSQENLEEI